MNKKLAGLLLTVAFMTSCKDSELLEITLTSDNERKMELKEENSKLKDSINTLNRKIYISNYADSLKDISNQKWDAIEKQDLKSAKNRYMSLAEQLDEARECEEYWRKQAFKQKNRADSLETLDILEENRTTLKAHGIDLN